MSIFDKIRNQPQENGAIPAADTAGSSRSVPVTFSVIPETLDEFTSLPQALLQTPFDTAALFIVALCVYPLSKEESAAMINYLRGPNPMSQRDLLFLRDRMAQNNKAAFLGASYFDGAVPSNDYMPAEPYTLFISENPYSYDTPGCARLLVSSGGGDTPRPVTMRLAKDGRWYLWEFSTLLVDIRPPESTNPWA